MNYKYKLGRVANPNYFVEDPKWTSQFGVYYLLVIVIVDKTSC